MNSCPTCNHAMLSIGYGMYHCGQCGTLLGWPVMGGVLVPALVRRCRGYQAGGMNAQERTIWSAHLIPEAIGQPLKPKET